MSNRTRPAEKADLPAPVAPSSAPAPQPAFPSVSDADIEAIVHARHHDAFGVLGPHEVGPGVWEVRAMIPDANSVKVVLPSDGQKTIAMEKRHQDGFFVARFESNSRPDYRLSPEPSWGLDMRRDPYSFGPPSTHEGILSVRYAGDPLYTKTLGAQHIVHEGVKGYSFALWAPNARRVSVVGNFNGWDGRRHQMRLHHDGGVWDIFIPDLAPGEVYKYEIVGSRGNLLPLKADPVAFAAERQPRTGSITVPALDFEWNDAAWLKTRDAADRYRGPMSIYECHLGSWMRADGNRYLTYKELAEKLVPYVRDMGFTHIELMPITEYPFDGSWGYQPISMFAPTSRFGTPADFAAFVDAVHQAGVGLILDWVPGHFPGDPHGIREMDGTALYEHADPRQGFHPDWNTYIYNLGRPEVLAFMVASARFWLERYHIDGLRVDAVASMLYLDYSREHDEWIPNQYGGRENLESVAFFKALNEIVYTADPGIMTIAEESTAWPGVSKPTYAGGLGFGFKWNMGWMHDTLEYIQHEAVHRSYHHHEISFGFYYAFDEQFILPLSHDEVVHGKKSLLDRFPGDGWQKFAGLRAYYGFMWGHPGKKLIFMGSEFAQGREWNHDRSLDWHLLENRLHAGTKDLVHDLNAVYRATPALYQGDFDSRRFEWLIGDDSANSVFVFLRRGDDENAFAIVATNFTPVPRYDYRVPVPLGGHYREVINTDAARYGGSNVGNSGGVDAYGTDQGHRPYALSLTLPPLATVILVREG